MPPSIKEYIMTTRKRVNDITEMMRENNYHMQKMTINFPKDVNDNYYCRDEVFEHLKKIPEITLVSGGYGNLEFTKAGVDKGVALHKLAQILNIAADETMASWIDIVGSCKFYPTAKAEWADVKQGVIEVEQNALLGDDVQTLLDDLQADIAG